MFNPIKWILSNAALHEGEPGGGGPAPDGGATPPEGDGGATPPEGGGPAPDGGATPPEGGNEPWYAGVQDDDLRVWASQKGWTDPEVALKSHRELERLMGGPRDELVRIPTTGLDLENREVLERLGAPKEATGYEFNLPEGVELDENRANWARDLFHKAGLTPAQAHILATADAELQAQQVAAAQKAIEEGANLGEQKLRNEWGNGYDNRIKMGERAVKALGLSGEMVDALEAAIGYEATIRWASNIGAKLGEDTFTVGDPQTGGDNVRGFTPDQARARLDERMKDPEFSKALFDKHHPKHGEAVKERTSLFKLIFPEG